MEKICKEHIHDISEDLAKDLVTLASSELTQSNVRHTHQQQCVWCLVPGLYHHPHLGVASYYSDTVLT